MEELTLDDLRVARGVTQTKLSQSLGISQAAVSKIEFRGDTYISSLRRYIEAMEGKLEIHAVFQDQTVKIRGLGDDGNRNQLRELTSYECKLIPSPVHKDGRPAENSLFIQGMDHDERYLKLTLGAFQVLIPVRRILDVSPPAPHEKLATLTIDGEVQLGPGPNDCGFKEGPRTTEYSIIKTQRGYTLECVRGRYKLGLQSLAASNESSLIETLTLLGVSDVDRTEALRELRSTGRTTVTFNVTR